MAEVDAGNAIEGGENRGQRNSEEAAIGVGHKYKAYFPSPGIAFRPRSPVFYAFVLA